MSGRLQDKVAIVTGRVALCGGGAHVIAADLNMAALQGAAAEAAQTPTRCSPCCVM
ncbi:MAG: hypothetical protein R2911_46425 [Caldilineaceae bacterium]